MPKTSGTIEAPLSGPASITRDSLGVPHIRAGSLEDAIFLQGYVTAQDRLWQMDAVRRLATGLLAEVIGPTVLELDRESRRLRLHRLAEMHAARLPAEDRRWAAAYARGVNYFLETHRGRLPPEFTVLDYEPRLWTISDTIAVGLQMHRDLTTIWKREVAHAAMLAATTTPDLVRQLHSPQLGPDIQPGSNAWAISGKLTASGKPILASDPHLEYSVPSNWYMIRLEAPGLNVAGVSLPGVPAVLIGHNERIAWGITNLQFDVQDLYIEQLDLGSGRYLHGGQVRQARFEHELIPVKGGRPVEFTNWVTHHGPVWQSSGGQSLSLRWTGAEAGLLEFPFVELNMARDWQSFRAALRRFYGPGQNFVYADVDGNIGYQATGALPVRRGFTGDLPVDGISGKFEWDGFMPFEDLPTVYNPAEGYVISANQNPFPPESKHGVNGDFAPAYRARQIRRLLTARSGWKPEEMLAVQKDVYSSYHHFLAAEAVAANGADADAVRLLRDWDGQMEIGRPAPMIASLFDQQLRLELVKRAVGKPATWDSTVASATVAGLLRSKPSEWYGDWNATLVACLGAAMEEGRRLQGRNSDRWDYGAFMILDLKHPILSRLAGVGRYFGTGPERMSGSSTSVKQLTRRIGPSMRFVADLSDWNKSLNNITLGQSGHVLSSHFKDQWKAYWTGESFPMRWTDVQGNVLEVRPAAGR